MKSVLYFFMFFLCATQGQAQAGFPKTIAEVSSTLAADEMELRCAGLMQYFWGKRGRDPYQDLRQGFVDRAVAIAKTKTNRSSTMLEVGASQYAQRLSDHYDKLATKKKGRKTINSDEELCKSKVQ